MTFLRSGVAKPGDAPSPAFLLCFCDNGAGDGAKKPKPPEAPRFEQADLAIFAEIIVDIFPVCGVTGFRTC